MSETQSIFTRSFIAERNLLIVLGVAAIFGAVYVGDMVRNWINLDFGPLRFLFIIFLISCCGILAINGINALYRALMILIESPGEEKGLWTIFGGCLILGFFYGTYVTPFSASVNFLLSVPRDAFVLLSGMALGILVLTIAHDTKRKID